MARVRLAFTSPATTLTFHGWILLPLGLRLATARISSTVARPTGVGRKARTDLREVIAPSTADCAVSAGVMSDPSRIDRAQCFHALRNFAEKQTLDVFVLEQVPGAAFARELSE